MRNHHNLLINYNIKIRIPSIAVPAINIYSLNTIKYFFFPAFIYYHKQQFQNWCHGRVAIVFEFWLYWSQCLHSGWSHRWFDRPHAIPNAQYLELKLMDSAKWMYLWIQTTRRKINSHFPHLSYKIEMSSSSEKRQSWCKKVLALEHSASGVAPYCSKRRFTSGFCA